MMTKEERTTLIAIAMHEMHPEYFKTEDKTEKDKIIAKFYDEVLDAGLESLTNVIIMLKDLSEQRGEKA